MFSMINIIKITNNEWGRLVSLGGGNEEGSRTERQFGQTAAQIQNPTRPIADCSDRLLLKRGVDRDR